MKLKVKKIHPDAIIPTRAHATDSGMDLYSLEKVILAPGETMIIKTGIAMDIPPGYEIQVRPRSGLSARTKLRVANSPATVDSGYQSDISVIMFHSGVRDIGLQYSDANITINKGDRIAQAVLCPVVLAELEEVTDFNNETERGTNGFGSTGK